MLPSGKKEDITTPAALSADNTSAGSGLPAEMYSIVNLLEDPCCLVLSGSRILTANPSFLSLIGLSNLHTHQQQNFTDWVLPKDRPLLQRLLLLAKAKQQAYEITIQLLQGPSSYRPHQLRILAAGTAIAILIKSSKKNGTAEDAGFESLTAASLVYDSFFNLIRFNHHFCQMLGYNEAELQKMDLVSLLHPQDLPAFTENMRSLVRRERKGFACELQLRHRDQRYLWIQYTASLIETSGEEPYITAVALDISQLKQKESKLMQEQEDMSLFLDRVTHDMKGPLRSLMALHHIVQLEYGHDSKVMEYFNHYHATVERLNATVSNLLTLSQVSRGTPRVGLVNLRNMVQDCLQSLCHLPDFYRINFTIRIEVKENILIEEQLLQTIVQNLLENAIKYCSDTTPKVLISIYLKEQELVLDISDNGIGIDEEAQAHIFDMFYRATTRSSGTGLGLYILKNAVDKLKGTIHVRSKPRKGSRFIVNIPYTAPAFGQEGQ